MEKDKAQQLIIGMANGLTAGFKDCAVRELGRYGVEISVQLPGRKVDVEVCLDIPREWEKDATADAYRISVSGSWYSAEEANALSAIIGVAAQIGAELEKNGVNIRN